MKKKIIALTLCLAMIAVGMISGTLAYFQSTDNADNVFTVGNVKIDLIEQQRPEVDAEGTELVDFVQSKLLMPIVGSAQTTNKDQWGGPNRDEVKNYVDKITTVENTGASPAWVRFYWAIPSCLDDGYETFNAGENVLHFNFGNYKDDDDVWHTTFQNQWDWKTASSRWRYFETTIKGIKYNVYFANYYQPLAAGATTEQATAGLYLDMRFDMKMEGDPEAPVYYKGNEALDLNELVDDDGYFTTVTCPVYSIACQSAGFDTADAAFDAAFGAQFNPWSGETTNWQE